MCLTASLESGQMPKLQDQPNLNYKPSYACETMPIATRQMRFGPRCVCNFNVSSQTGNGTLTLITYHLRILGFLKCNISHASLQTKQVKFVHLFSSDSQSSCMVHEITVGSHVFVTVWVALCWIYSRVEISR